MNLRDRGLSFDFFDKYFLAGCERHSWAAGYASQRGTPNRDVQVLSRSLNFFTRRFLVQLLRRRLWLLPKIFSSSLFNLFILLQFTFEALFSLLFSNLFIQLNVHYFQDFLSCNCASDIYIEVYCILRPKYVRLKVGRTGSTTASITQVYFSRLVVFVRFCTIEYEVCRVECDCEDKRTCQRSCYFAWENVGTFFCTLSSAVFLSFNRSYIYLPALFRWHVF